MGAARTAILFLAISVFLALPAFYGGEGGELDIWQQGLFAAAAPRRIVLEYRQAPFWNPWGSGGVPCLGHPYSSFLSPGYVFILVFGPVAGLKLRAAAALWAGLAGGWLLGRRFSPGRFAPFLCAGVYLFSSWYPLYISRWHAEFIPFCYLPWLFLCYLKGVDDLRWTAWGGIFLALMLLDGGTYPPPLAALLLGIYAVLDAGVRRSWRPVAAAAMVILLGLAISGVKLLPMARFIMDNPRYTYWREPVLPLRALPRIFLGRDQLSPTSFAGAWLGWWEYGAYVGVVPMTLAALGVFIGRRRIIPAAACAIVFFGVMLGDFGGPAPWRWLHRLPPFSSLHDTVRFRVPLVFCLALLSSAALSRVEEEGAPLRGGMRAAFLGLLGVVQEPAGPGRSRIRLPELRDDLSNLLPAAHGGVVADGFGHDVARAGQGVVGRGRGVGQEGAGQRCGRRARRRLGQDQVGQRPQSPLAGDGGAGAALGPIGGIEVFEGVERLGRLKLGL